MHRACHLLVFMVLLASVYESTLAQTGNVPRRDDKGATDEASRDERVPELCRRLAQGIRALGVEPDPDGKYTFVLDSGVEQDTVERQRYYFWKKARVYATQGRVTKISFEYYRFSLINMVRETKVLTTGTPDSPDLSTLEVEYSSNADETKRYRVGDLGKDDSRRSVVKQYVSYLINLVMKIEMYRNKRVRVETLGIERTIQLGD